MSHTFGVWVSTVGGVHATGLVLGSADQNRVIGMSLDVLLEILRALERLAAEVALVGLQGNMDADVGSNMVSLHSGCPTSVPLACEVEVVGALAADVLFTDMLLKKGMSAIALVHSK